MSVCEDNKSSPPTPKPKSARPNLTDFALNHVFLKLPSKKSNYDPSLQLHDRVLTKHDCILQNDQDFNALLSE